MEIQIPDLGELFERAQMENIFPDNKTFVDCTPKLNISSIRDRYNEKKNQADFNLKEFVHQYFELPEMPNADFHIDKGKPILEHLNTLWDTLTRKPEKSTNSLISLPYPYVVPGGRFREIYYWDSYFTMLGLQVSGRLDLIQNMIDNFSFLIDSIGFIPNGNRTYYLGRSQPPFFACMVNLLSEEKGKSVLVDYLPQLEKEYNFWVDGKAELSADKSSVHRLALLPDAHILNHYWDENDTPRPEAFKEDSQLAQAVEDKKSMFRHLRAGAESGWDYSSRWFRNKNDFSSIRAAGIIPVDLNCLLFNLEKTIAEAYQLSGDKNTSEKYITLMNTRKKAIDQFCWNEQEGFYFDYDYVNGAQTKSWTLAAAFPLYFGTASKEQAGRVSLHLKEKFLSAGGLITTTETTGQQWDAPNGWAPLQWIAIQGLVKYGFTSLAKDITQRWLSINQKVFNDTGKMMEKYNVVSTNLEAGGGEYPAQDGFGWTNGVYLALDKWMKESHANS
ncbi:MAG TPA: alpha,alpha-trehalase TreF [Hanamia sp.]|nr:alpha,alpha-trehalase TreF [Hanamia sp.]